MIPTLLAWGAIAAGTDHRDEERRLLEAEREANDRLWLEWRSSMDATFAKNDEIFQHNREEFDA